MAELNGGCRCGGVRFTASAEPIFTGICHCTNCQRFTGSAFATVVAVPTPAFSVTGATTRFDDQGDSGKATHRWFCPVCGATVYETADLMENVTMIPVGALDDPAMVRPAMQIYCDSALPWARYPEMQSFPKLPMGA